MKQTDRIVGFLQSLEANGILPEDKQTMMLVPEYDYLGGDVFNVCANQSSCTTNNTSGCGGTGGVNFGNCNNGCTVTVNTSCFNTTPQTCGLKPGV